MTRSHRSASASAADLNAARNLLYNLVRRDLAVRYRSTLLGFFWSFLKPMALAAIFFVVFQYVLGLELRERAVPYVAHLLTGILVWTFFSSATGEATRVILDNANLIKKVRLPLGVFPVATVCSHMVHFVLALIVLFTLLIFVGLPPGLPCLAVAPIMLLQFATTLAFSLILCALNVFYRDVANLWEVALQAWFYATPIIYPVYMATGKLDERGLTWLKWLYLSNPMTPICLAWRRILLYAPLDSPALEMPDAELWLSLGLCALVTAGMLVVGVTLFRRLSRSFVDVL